MTRARESHSHNSRLRSHLYPQQALPTSFGAVSNLVIDGAEQWRKREKIICVATPAKPGVQVVLHPERAVQLELQEIHAWSAEELNVAWASLDDGLRIVLSGTLRTVQRTPHGVVQAMLILPGGKDMGPHLFLVQLRDLDTHKALAGLTTGDIGPKVMGGFAAVDNGLARFDHMLYICLPLVLNETTTRRNIMVTTAGWSIGRAATIAIRSATVRRQGELGQDGLERQVSLNVRLVARAYVFIEGWDDSWIQDIEGARRSMGGHGYSGFSGVGKIYADYLPAATYEGENYVLDGQVLRAALKFFRGICPTSSPPPTFSPTSAYLRFLLDKNLLLPELPPASWHDPAVPILLLEWRAALLVHETAQTVPIGQPDSTLTQRHTAIRKISRGDEPGILAIPPHNRRIRARRHALLRNLPRRAHRQPRAFARLDTLAIAALCETTLLPEIIEDRPHRCVWVYGQELDSALGVFGGRAYEALWKRAQDEPLNLTELTEA
ncbi:hypothetical protein C8F01DRAFT_1088750 [Mycena amicta]|nr:hypothetical protein C8F01DRAFT_1088750 [Mycena amicta]